MAENRIAAMDPGEVFSIADFEDLGEDKTISKILNRLCDEGVCEKVMRGIFWKNDGTRPNVDKVAQAIARSNKWNAVSSGETALRVLGVCDEGCDDGKDGEEPVEWTYITNNGTYRKYSVNGIVISFKRATSKAYGTISRETAQMIQFLKGLMNKNKAEDRDRIASSINGYFTNEEKDVIRSESSGMSKWLRKTVDGVFHKDKHQHPGQETE